MLYKAVSSTTLRGCRRDSVCLLLRLLVVRAMCRSTSVSRAAATFLQVYGDGNRPTDATTILDGGVRPPHEFDVLIDELQGIESHDAPMRIASDLSLQDRRPALGNR